METLNDFGAHINDGFGRTYYWFDGTNEMAHKACVSASGCRHLESRGIGRRTLVNN
ncbi:hypothetical protein Scep_001440 [Stephania cephalantha]|uniref:Uncharacterized protein n=1 Tax=Stephania cephalantha TaxID=152367 RepID=A0AAP0LBS1_9MAGN